MILDFQLKCHDKFLRNFIKLFRQFDSDKDGIISEEEYRNLIDAMDFGINEKDLSKMLQNIDPYNHQQITFSQCVTLFSSVQLNKNYFILLILKGND